MKSRVSFSRLLKKIGESRIDLKHESPHEVLALCDQEIPPRGIFTVTIQDCQRRCLILDILRLRPEREATYHFLMGEDKDLFESNLMRLSAEAPTMRFELTEMRDTVELALVNPSLWKRMHLRMTIFEENPSQFLPSPPPEEVLRFKRKRDRILSEV